MIIVKLMGGLGNQMFQYACGRRLSFIHKVPLLLDTRFLDDKEIRQNFTVRDYELNIFKLNANIAEHRITNRFYNSNYISRFIRKISYPRIIIEEHRKLNDRVLMAPSSAYLVGYWQSEEYFKDISDIIKEELAFPEKCENDYVSELCESMKNTNSIAIHIRRGDYATNKHINSVHGLLDLDYYRKAVNLINRKIVNAKFYLFSDDPGWVSKNFVKNINAVNINHHKPVRNYVDMKLMSYCQHNIIANSSYSWWGAWLNKNPDKIVIAPQKWYAVGNNIEIAEYRIPGSWHTI